MHDPVEASTGHNFGAATLMNVQIATKAGRQGDRSGTGRLRINSKAGAQFARREIPVSSPS
ncbi:hypothetical protein [Salinibacterium sp.]|uniref:hypothetical protein n=1 Tax=Salinibacterium sp. TaxID=1915057 RepID=UPI00286BB7BA|nr:hypothetical protein [Salinibacterium sp.]